MQNKYKSPFQMKIALIGYGQDDRADSSFTRP